MEHNGKNNGIAMELCAVVVVPWWRNKGLHTLNRMLSLQTKHVVILDAILSSNLSWKFPEREGIQMNHIILSLRKR